MTAQTVEGSRSLGGTVIKRDRWKGEALGSLRISI